MDLNPLGSLSHFDTFDDDVSKGSNDLTVDAGLSNEGPFLSSVSVASQDISQSLTIVPTASSNVQQQQPTEPAKRKGGWTKGKKRGKKGGTPMKDSNAPSKPLSGYMRFVAERRAQLRIEQPSMGFAEMYKLMGAEWSTLAQPLKQRYLDEAERERVKYLKDLEAYQQTDAYKTFRKQFEKKCQEETSLPTVVSPPQASVAPATIKEEDESSTFDIPIFTEEFLEHNKSRDAELRQLRKQTTELEEQNAILSKHTDNMRQAVERLEVEASQNRQTNQALSAHLDALRSCLTTAFSSVSLPGTGELPTLETIDSYMARLHSLILDSPQENEALIATVREIVGRLSVELDPSKDR